METETIETPTDTNLIPEKETESKESKKAFTLYQISRAVEKALREAKLLNDDSYYWLPQVEVYSGFAIITSSDGMTKVEYTISEDTYEVTLGEPRRVKMVFEEVENEVIPSITMKSIGEDRVGAYAVLWGTEESTDLHGEFFTPNTKEMTVLFDVVGALPLLYHHGLDKELKTSVLGKVDTLKSDDLGIWYEAQLTIADKYKDIILKLIEEGKLRTSTQTFPTSKKSLDTTGEITRWPIVEVTATPTPAEFRMLEYPLEQVKSIFDDAGIEVDQEILVKTLNCENGEELNKGAEKARLQLVQTQLKAKMLEL